MIVLTQVLFVLTIISARDNRREEEFKKSFMTAKNLEETTWQDHRIRLRVTQLNI